MKQERFCSNCKHYKPLERYSQINVCKSPVQMFKVKKNADDYCPYHELSQKVGKL